MDEPKYGFDSITSDTFTSLLTQYPHTVPKDLAKLEEQRLQTIPQLLKSRSEAPQLTKPELTILMDWKLSHGKFRPTLKSLIAQNPPSLVSETTQEAFKQYACGGNAELRTCIKTLTALKGVGPATASLLLSTYEPTSVPFFSDELFRWAFYGSGRGNGWDRKIKYTLKEYLDVAGRVEGFRKRFDGEVGCLEVEKVAYVLGKMGSRDEDGPGTVNSHKRRVSGEDELEGNISTQEGGPSAAKRGKLSSPDVDKSKDDLTENTSTRVTRSRK